jgi:hypothetical protein
MVMPIVPTAPTNPMMTKM